MKKYIFMCLGLILAGLGFVEFNTSRKLVKTGIRTEARVVDIMEYNDGNNNASGVHRNDIEYKLVFEYTDRSGASVRFKSRDRSKFPGKEIGDIVKIIYQPNNITQRIDSFWGLYFGSIVSWCFGFVFCCFGLRGIIRRDRYEPK